MEDKKLIFNNIAEALDYSKRNYNRNNIIKSLETEKQIAGKLSRDSMKNPVLYVITKVENKNSIQSKPKIHKYKFTTTLSGFDQL